MSAEREAPPRLPPPLWAALRPGDQVELYGQGLLVHAGTVQDRSNDGLFLWVVDRIGHRRLFHALDGHEVAVTGWADGGVRPIRDVLPVIVT